MRISNVHRPEYTAFTISSIIKDMQYEVYSLRYRTEPQLPVLMASTAVGYADVYGISVKLVIFVFSS